MFIEHVPSAGPDDAPSGALYKRAAEAQRKDLVAEVRTAVEFGMHDPRDSVETACSGCR
ncbi:hypothetical protein ACFWIA_32955 [Streptomyces sp. NPDC127068]|uniref:hypothetical protein n=1 Tax=Streptomyces sp. NPDC127068 TaxID=3347127 RepID=UPI00364DAD5A